MRPALTRGKPMLQFVCGAGVTHYGTEKQVMKWRQEGAEKTIGYLVDKARAHDDYLAGMRLFRERLALVPDLRGTPTAFGEGYQEAVRDLDRAFLDAVKARQDEEDHQ